MKSVPSNVQPGPTGESAGRGTRNVPFGAGSSPSATMTFTTCALYSRQTARRATGQDHAPPADSVKLVIVTCWPDAIEVLSSVMSPPPPVAVIVPCICTVVPSLA